MRPFSTWQLARFAAAFTCCTLVFAVLWECCLNGKVYNCTDSVDLPDYIFPGGWAHHPVTVEHLVPTDDMSQPDTIQAGWTLLKLWLLWLACITISALISALCAMNIPWGKQHINKMA